MPIFKMALVGGVLLSLGCQAAGQPMETALQEGYSTIEAVDPARTSYHGWKSVDEAILGAAMEMLIVARPTGKNSVHSRDYSLRTLQGNPGELLVTRRGVGLGIEASEGLTIQCRIGLFGDRQDEQELLDKVRRALVRQHRIEHE